MNKRSAIIALVAIVLVALLFLFENPFEREEPAPRPEQQVELVVPLSEDEISRIELSNQIGTSVTLVRKGRRWFTRQGHPADPNRIDQLISGLQEIKDPELVSINPDSHMQYRVHPLIGIRIRVYDMSGKPRTDIIVGEPEREFFSVYVRRTISDNVYRVGAMLRGLARGPWRDRNILRLAQESIQSIDIEAPEESYSLARGPDGLWGFGAETTGTVDQKQADMLARRLANLTTNDFVEPTTATDVLTSYGLVNPKATLTVTMEDGTSQTVYFGTADEEGMRVQYYAKRGDDPQIFLVAEPTYNSVIREKITLVAPPEPPKPEVMPEAITTGTAVTSPTTEIPAETVPSSPTAAPEAQPASPAGTGVLVPIEVPTSPPVVAVPDEPTIP